MIEKLSRSVTHDTSINHHQLAKLELINPQKLVGLCSSCSSAVTSRGKGGTVLFAIVQ